jgi:peptide methionine sulfoxide reductase msrA/msrB
MLIKAASLPPILLKITHDKATEYPFTGTYTDLEEAGSYLCRQCGLALFRSQCS